MHDKIERLVVRYHRYYSNKNSAGIKFTAVERETARVALCEAMDWFPGIQLGRPPSPVNVDGAVRQYHLDKGCCDGSDASACYAKRQADMIAEREATKAKTSSERVPGPHEYDGCEPSEGDMAFCPVAHNHKFIKMGFKCYSCGFTA